MPIDENPTLATMRDTERSEFGARLFAARKRADMSQAEVAQAVGISQGTYAQAERSGQGSAHVLKMATVLKVDPGWLANGVGEMSGRREAEEIDLDLHPDLVSVRRVQLKLQAGVSGFALEVDQTSGPPIFFRADWLQSKGYKPYALVALKITGQSMEPTLYPNDMVVVNTADREPRDGRVYAVNYEGEAVIKRMVRDGGAWWLSSDNPDQRRYPRKECTEGSCIVVGQVIHKQSEQI
jgi:phage repressor protein C with HTH and peptisase S24 domain